MKSRAARLLAAAGFAHALTLAWPDAAVAQTLSEALQQAYRTNPVLRAQQRSVPAAAASVDRARAGFLPKVSASAEQGFRTSVETTRSDPDRIRTRTRPRGMSVDVTQVLFDGARTFHSVGQADHQLAAARATLSDTEQSMLLDAATAYLDVLRDRTILRLERRNHASLVEQFRLIRELFGYGDVTDTDVAQVEARVASGAARVSSAEAAAKGSEAIYEQVIGARPANLVMPPPADWLLPRTLDLMLAKSAASHPGALAARAIADSADSQAKAAFAEHFPTVSVTGSWARDGNSDLMGDQRTSKSVFGRVTVPIFSGGETSARVREAQENAGRRRIEIDAFQARVRAGALRAWTQAQAAKVQLAAAERQVAAASRALLGVRAEFGLGQRSAANVLDAVQDLLSASINLASAQRDRILTTYAASRAMGALSFDQVGPTPPGGAPSAYVDAFARLSAPVRPSSVLTRWEMRDDGRDASERCQPGCAPEPWADAPLRLTYQ